MAAPRVPFNVTALNIEVPADGQREVTFSVATGVLDDTWTVEIAGTTVAEGDGTDSFVAVFPASADGQRWQLSHEGIERAAGVVIPRPLRNALDLTTLELTVDDGDTVVGLEVVAFGGGGGAVDSVNGETGTVVLTASDVGADPAGTAAALTAADVGAEATGVAAALVDDLSGVTNASTARTNLGLGTAATTAATDYATAAHNHSGVYEAVGVAAALIDDLSGVSNASTARTNLGLGGAAVLAVGTTAGTVAAGDDARLSDARTPTAHNHAASEVTSGTLDIARIPTGTTSTTVPLGNDSRFGPVPGQGLYVAGSLYGTPCATGGTRTVANGSLYFFPIIIDGTTATADALCINVLTGVGSSTVHLYLVSSSATTGRPTAASTVLAKASNVSTASSSTRVVAAFDSSATASLTRGTYWGAIHSIAGTPTLRAAASAFQFGPPVVQQTPDTANGITLIYATGGGTSTTALTSLAGLSFNAADLNQAPIVFWRAA